MSTISYYLRENGLSTSDETQYFACVKNNKPLDQEGVIKRMLKKNTTVTRQDIVVVLDLLKETMMEEVLEGTPIRMDLFRAGVSIKGGFASPSDCFSKDKHKLKVNINTTSEFEDEVAHQAELEKVIHSSPKPFIREVFDFETLERATEFHAGNLIEVKGAYMRDDNEDTFAWLRAEDENGVKGDKYPMARIHRVFDRTVLCELPQDAPAGTYRLYVSVGEGDDGTAGDYKQLLTLT